LLRNIPAEQRPTVIDALTTLVQAAANRPAPLTTSAVAHD
jgi:hypothetical protein